MAERLTIGYQWVHRSMLGLLDNQVQRYPWGSHTLIQQLAGWASDGTPLAEVWYGTHPRAPSRLARDGTSLMEVLGREQGSRQGLPFLLKLIAVAQPLSLQAHPNATAARHGYEREEQQRIALTARQRNYPDPQHKPELLVALSPFQALVGFAEPGQILEAVERVANPTLSGLMTPLRAQGDLARCLAQLLGSAPAEQAALLSALSRACTTHASAPDPIGQRFRTAAALQQSFPGDLGALLALFLNQLELQPGQGLFVGPGILHAYLRGLGVEIMANSDNVLRCGLTPKHVDIPELLTVLDVSATPALLSAQAAPRDQSGSQEAVYRAPVSEFTLSRFDLAMGHTAELAAASPEIVLCTAGRMELQQSAEVLALGPVQAAFVSAGTRYTLSGNGTCFRASAGTSA